VVEAKEFQLPVIGFDNCKGVNLLIRNGVNGILVDGSGNRITSLTEGLEKLMRSQTLRKKLGKKQIFGIEKYESDRVIQKWVELLGTRPCSQGERNR
jgi:glycosyltransferase involved in cell wall biosynthesis